MDFWISSLGLNHYKVRKAFLWRYCRENRKTIYKILFLSDVRGVIISLATKQFRFTTSTCAAPSLQDSRMDASNSNVSNSAMTKCKLFLAKDFKKNLNI